MARVLLVEDENVTARHAQHMLRKLGHVVTGTAACADSARALFERDPPELVLMDITLAGAVDGVDTAVALRASKDVPIIFLTSAADAATTVRARQSDPFAFLLKPVDERALGTALEIALAKHRRQTGLQDSERWLSTTLRCLGDSVVATDPEGLVTFLNPAAEGLIGCDLAAAAGRPVSDLLLLNDESDPNVTVHPVDSALRHRAPVGLRKHRLVSPLRRCETFVEARVSPIIDGAGTLLGAVLVLRDISAQRDLEARAALSDRLAAVATLAGGAAHEINNPLACVLMNASFAAEELANCARALERESGAGPTIAPRLREVLAALAELDQGAHRVGSIVAGLRTFAQAPPPNGESIELTAAIHAATHAARDDLALLAWVRSELGPAPKVLGSARRFVEALVQLLCNAAQATRSDGRRHGLRIALGTDPQGSAVIELHDTGAGMDPGTLARIFDPFFTTRGPGRVGLGLSVCHGIVVREMGGSLGAESVAGQGSTFRITLPRTPLR